MREIALGANVAEFPFQSNHHCDKAMADDDDDDDDMY